MALKVFVDFDGTVTRKDVGNEFFMKFGGDACGDLIAEYRRGGLSAKELFRREVEAIGKLDTEQALEFLHNQEIDRSFIQFVDFCRERGIEFHIVSDGLDFYIHEILGYHGIEGVSVFSNKLTLREDGTAGINFPYDDAECTRCACCKRNIIVTSVADDDVVVYVGEGYSDRCPVRYADIVFAKDDLQRYCQEMNITYHMYGDFEDVTRRLEMILSGKRLKQRREAVMARRDLFISEP